MKVITIFNEKGGTGKSVLTCLFASWLSYAKGEKVTVLDFDHPSYQFNKFRKADLQNIESNPSSELAKLSSGHEPYKILYIKADKPGLAVKVIRKVLSENEGEEGYLILDFGGSFKQGDPSYEILRAGLVDSLFIPADSDQQSRIAAMFIVSELRNSTEASGRTQDIALIWNRETAGERKNDGKYHWYDAAEKQFRALGVDIAPVKVHEMVSARRGSDIFGFIRSTTCWNAMGVNSRCPYITELFEYMKGRIDGK